MVPQNTVSGVELVCTAKEPVVMSGDQMRIAQLLVALGADLDAHGSESTGAPRSPGSTAPQATARHLCRVSSTARGSTSAASTEHPARSAATAEEPLPTKGSHTVIPGAALPASIREKSATGF